MAGLAAAKRRGRQGGRPPIIDAETLENLLKVDTELVKSELPQVKEFLAKLGERLPVEMTKQIEELERKLG